MNYVKTLNDSASILKEKSKYTTYEDVVVREDVPHNDYVTNCYMCKRTCCSHSLVDDITKCWCFHFDPDKNQWRRPPEERNANTANSCHVCGCPHTHHGNDFKIYKVVKKQVTKTNEDLLKKYNIMENDKN